MILFDCNTIHKMEEWHILNDAVMGGMSNGHFKLNTNNHIEFYGTVSLENNGGFSMLQHTFNSKSVSDYNCFILKLKGDGKTYQFRVKTNSEDKHSYITQFKTTSEWQTIEVPFNQLAPKFRGRSLDFENYTGQQLERIAFLIGNKKAENFDLEIQSVSVTKTN